MTNAEKLEKKFRLAGHWQFIEILDEVFRKLHTVLCYSTVLVHMCRQRVRHVSSESTQTCSSLQVHSSMYGVLDKIQRRKYLADHYSPRAMSLVRGCSLLKTMAFVSP